jgi:hypothetical protein
MKVDLQDKLGADQHWWWTEFLDSIICQCVQLQSFTIENLTGVGGACTTYCNFSWQAQGPNLPALLTDLASGQMPYCAEALLSAECSVQALSDADIQGGGAWMAPMLLRLLGCNALARMTLRFIECGDCCSNVSKEALKVAVSHESLEQAVIELLDCNPVFDPSSSDDQAMLLQLATSTRDLDITLSAAEPDYVAGNLVLLCNAPSVHSLSLRPGQQQEHLGASHSWKQFSFLRSLSLTDVLLDDSCIAALNCLTLLEVLQIGFTTGGHVHNFLTTPITLPCLQQLDVESKYMPLPQQLQQAVSAAGSWQGGSCVTYTLIYSDNLVSLLRTPQLNSVWLENGLVTAQTFLQLQQRSPNLHPDSCDMAVLVDDLQLAAVAKSCPELLASGRCCFWSITHYGLTSAALTTGAGLTALCGAGTDVSHNDDPLWGVTLDTTFLDNLALPALADDSSILVLAQHCTNLTKLQLHSTNRAFTKQSILHIAAHLPSLRVLELLGCTGLDDSSLFALARGCPRLSHLSLDGLSWVAELALCVSLLMLHELHSVSLVEADQFTIAGLRSLLTGSSALQHVHLPSPALMWHVIFKQMAPAQLDAWGAGRILQVWHGAHSSMLHVQRVPAALQP